ncbi:hypothetical protein CANARDRAFT_179170, partial [[Candida] arabinofermentans NRRL YB-2248]
NVLWRKQTQKKNKTWEGDGELLVNLDSDTGVLKNDEGIVLGSVQSSSKFIFKGVFKCGSYECELDGEASDTTQPAPIRPIVHLRPKSSGTTLPLQPRVLKNRPTSSSSSSPPPPLPALQVIPQKRFAPLLQRTKARSESPLYDPEADGAIVMPNPPNYDTDPKFFKSVVIDPLIGTKLREHQREGVKFLYECVMGYREFEGNGALLADEMGLGKTLQTITLIWTMLRQNSVVGQPPIAKKVLICCPVTLVGNWKREFKKWLGINSVSVLAIDGKGTNDKQNVTGFARTRVYQVLIIGYEKMLSLSKELQDAPFDLVVCDEGHRLKSGTNRVLKTLESFNIKRRIILSGTPIQNDLTEFYNIINFINPGVLGDLKEFQKNYMKPILRAREANCSNAMILKNGELKSKELIKLTKLFILRRTNEEISKYLPSRSDYIIFVPPTKLQIQLFKSMVQTNQFRKILVSNNMNDSLGLITTFRKICNSPSLLKDDGLFLELCDKKSDSDIEFRNELGNKIKSGKINMLLKILNEIYLLGNEKVVLISNFTQTLDILEKLLNALNLSNTRLDGSTPSKDRDSIVMNFNKSSVEDKFIFLLSAKSGGCGLNLIGASRLILFDNDWNPSIDIQAMARIHRDGQKKPVFIYRLLTAGCIDEKIFQRQLIKTNLSNKFLDESKNSNEDFFKNTDLKDLFNINEGSESNTHDLMGCDCIGDGEQVFDEEEEEEEDEEVVDLPLEKQSFTSALNYSQNFEDINDQNRKKQIKKCLLDYRHLNPLTSCESNDKVISNIL